MPGVRNLRDVLELVVDGLDNRAFAGEQFVPERHEAMVGGFLFLLGQGDELNALGKELLEERLGEVTLIGKEFAPEAFDQRRHRLTVIDIARREEKAQQFALVIDQ